MAAIFTLSSFALAVPLVSRFPFRDKGVHFCIYTALAFLIIRAARISWPSRSALRVAVFGAFMTILWGLSDELHQAFVPGRSADVMDWLADALGALTAASASLIWWRLRGAQRVPTTKRVDAHSADAHRADAHRADGVSVQDAQP